MPMNYSLVIEPFYVWGFYYMGPFPSSNGYTHILVVADYVTKYVQTIPTNSADHNTYIKMLKELIFLRFGVPTYFMIDGGSHFIHGAFLKLFARYDIDLRITSPYHPESKPIEK
uniref:Integrase catalytic domain-containing protein n=1 Tax=Hordeum vulgare subsp. vulgare TaxID=112509 RepID=A0A8I6XXM6_HORVV